VGISRRGAPASSEDTHKRKRPWNTREPGHYAQGQQFAKKNFSNRVRSLTKEETRRSGQQFVREYEIASSCQKETEQFLRKAFGGNTLRAHYARVLKHAQASGGRQRRGGTVRKKAMDVAGIIGRGRSLKQSERRTGRGLE